MTGRSPRSSPIENCLNPCRSAIHYEWRRRAAWDLYRSFLAVLSDGSLSAAARRAGARPADPRAPDRGAGAGAGRGAVHPLAGRACCPPRRRWRSRRTPRPWLRPPPPWCAPPRARRRGGGVVRLTASDIVGGEVLPPILAELREAHPRADARTGCCPTGKRTCCAATPTSPCAWPGRPRARCSAAGSARCAVGLFASPQLYAAPRRAASLEDRPATPSIGFDHVPPSREAARVSALP